MFLPGILVASVEDLRHAEEVDPSAVTFAPATILVVDDVATYRRLIEGYLKDLGLDLLEAENGAVAVDIVRERRPDLVLMDLRMPVLDGLAATKAIKEDPDLRSIPVIAVTGRVLNEDERETREVCDGYLKKPVQLGDLVATLTRFLQHRKEADQSEDQPVADDVDFGVEWSPEQMGEATRAGLTGLLSRLQREFAETREFLRNSGNVTEVEVLADDVLEASAGIEYPPLVSWARTLKTQAASFQVDELNETLDRLPALTTDLDLLVTAGQSNPPETDA